MQNGRINNIFTASSFDIYVPNCSTVSREMPVLLAKTDRENFGSKLGGIKDLRPVGKGSGCGDSLNYSD